MGASFNFSNAVQIEAGDGLIAFEHLHADAVGFRGVCGDPDCEVDALVIGLMHHHSYCEMAIVQAGDILEVAGTAQRQAPSAWLPRETVVIVKPRVLQRVLRAQRA